MKKPKINKNRAVQFVQPFSNRLEGDVAVFSPVLAASLVSQGVAVYRDKLAKQEPKQEDPQEVKVEGVKTKKSKKK